MRYIVDINEVQATEIKSLIDNGRYRNISQFINVAIENQLLIESSDLSQFQETPKDNEIVEKNKVKKEYVIDYKSIKTVSIPDISKTTLSLNDNINKGVWLWGQINRIFPVKIALRSLSKLIKNNEWVSLDGFKEFATEEAIRISALISEYEIKTKKNRDEKISAGLPKKENYKSQDRYKFHFLASMRNNDEKLDGAMAVLRMVNIKKGDNNKLYIGITKSGLDFAKLENPVLDNSNYEISMNEDEINFYLSYVKKYLKNEWEGIQWVLKKIGNSGTNRDTLNNNMKRTFQKKWNCTEAVLNTQRAGLMGRMTELGLIDKKKEGIYVTYLLSEFAKSIRQ